MRLARNFAFGLAIALLAWFGAAEAGTLSVLYSFTGGNDGRYPQGELLRDGSNFYGTTSEGGAGFSTCDGGCGTVFKLTRNGTESVIHAFTSKPDGADPGRRLIKDAALNLYGVTGSGGVNCPNFNYGCGTIFELASDGTETILYKFQGGADGGTPFAGMRKDGDGNFYGTALTGGCCNCGNEGCGTVFKLTPESVYSVLHTFTGGSDGTNAYGGVIVGPHYLYGTTDTGGDDTCHLGGCGVVYKLSMSGAFTVLHAFHGGSDGSFPVAGLIRDAAGNLYGTTTTGGAGCIRIIAGCGTVFRIAPDGNETVIYAFAGHRNGDGYYPQAGLFRDEAGNLYGTTYWGGKGCSAPGCGTIFKLAPDGSETVLYAFTGGSDGSYPVGGLIEDQAGNFYGMTVQGGAYGYGEVYELTP